MEMCSSGEWKKRETSKRPLCQSNLSFPSRNNYRDGQWGDLSNLQRFNSGSSQHGFIFRSRRRTLGLEALPIIFISFLDVML